MGFRQYPYRRECGNRPDPPAPRLDCRLGADAVPPRTARPPPDRARKPVWGGPDAAPSVAGTRARAPEAEAGGRDELPVVASRVQRELDHARRAGVADDAVGDGRRAE